MGISIASSSVDMEEVLEGVIGHLSSIPDGEGITIGNENMGMILHNSPGETKSGVDVDKDFWIEFYAEEFHFSEV